ncbi:MAG: hypothetical protein HY742_04065 [Deltaproteobacteria bacterium]|nr:hypothetical protein [Deltaproteobacteria bacterium]
MTTVATGKAFAVWYKEVERWSVQALWLERVNRSQWPTTELREVVSVRFEVVPIEEIDSGETLLLDRVAFDEGRIYFGRRTQTQMVQYRAKLGDIVVSKINARKRAVGLVTTEADIGVTIHFRSLIPDKSKVVPMFLWMALRSEFCRRQFEIETGGQGKGEISEEGLLGIKIPLPAPSVQCMIVDYWQEAQLEFDAKLDGLLEPVQLLNSRLTEAYRSACTRDVIHSRCFVVDFKDLSAWDVKSGQAASFRLACPSFRPMGDFIEDETELIHPAAEPDKDWPVYGVNNKEGVFLNSHQKGTTFNAPYKRIRKDWFFHNPTRCNVGSLGIVPDVPEDAITSPEYQVWRLKQDIPDPLLPGYVACLIQTPFFLELVQFNRVGAVKQRMYTENLMQVRIPYIPVSEQQKYADAREKALAELADAKHRLNQARQEVEAMILGVKKIEVP